MMHMGVKYATVLSFMVLMTACTGNNKKIQSNSPGRRLYEIGFLKYAEQSKIDSLKTGLIDSFDIFEDENNKIVHVDAEELAEFNFDFFMPDIIRIIAKRDLVFDVKVTEDYESSYAVAINGERIQLYTRNEMDEGTFWDTAPKNFFRALNSQLQVAKKNELFYLLIGGNDLHVLLLTEEEYKIIAEKYEDYPNDTIYLP